MSRILARYIGIFVLTAGLLTPGCGDRQDTGPPDLHLGEDVCDFCSMIISDQRFAAACVIRDADDRRHTAAFDDIGCLLAMDTTLQDSIEHRYVVDYNTGEWATASQATFIISPEIRSPMASGIIASQSSEDAAELAKRFKGTTRRYDELAHFIRQDTSGTRPPDPDTTQDPPVGSTPPDTIDAANEKPE